MYSNRRRDHIHIIRQYSMPKLIYTGSRIVIFKKNYNNRYIKDIFDIDNFITHKYKNSKDKKNTISKWMIKDTTISDVIKKEMINYSLDKKFKMYHIIYESEKLEMKDFIKSVFVIENLPLNEQKVIHIHTD